MARSNKGVFPCSCRVTTQDIATGNLELSQRTESQAASLQQTAASLEELSGSVHQNAEVTRHAADEAQAAREAVESGAAAVGQVVDTMQQVSAANRQIGEIVALVDGIAFQTNLLALNAAVEAARAGESGRGFAVVAGEVRALAHRSAEAARQVQGVVAGSLVAPGLRSAVEAARRIKDFARKALELASLCSNDPICAHHQPGEHDHAPLLGAACHGCVLVPETSCEQRNEFLDRALVVPTVESCGAELGIELLGQRLNFG